MYLLSENTLAFSITFRFSGVDKCSPRSNRIKLHLTDISGIKFHLSLKSNYLSLHFLFLFFLFAWFSSGPTASLVLASPLQALSRSSTSSLTLHVPLVLRDVSSGLTSTATVTVSVCPCLRGGARAGEKEKQTDAEWERETVCLPQHSSLPSPGLSTAALLAILACGATLLGMTMKKTI